MFYYLAAIIFGLGHIFNFAPIHYNLIYFYPVFVLPQLIMGFGFGYVRIKYGFFFGLLLHCITNTLPLLFHLLIGSI
ncbi:CPBP family glutamic-type intramembrane protease [Arachidicoccus rhizosphaerae]|uniref:CPBP family glutamic-type intramembrane protease n=1 Tax=Arachidicoccus rhizosphaerae TaxID=551991 RepID=UPI000B8469A8